MPLARGVVGSRYRQHAIYAKMRRLSNIFLHMRLTIYVQIVIMYRHDAIAANRWLLTNVATDADVSHYRMSALESPVAGQAAVCASPTFKRSVKKYSEEVSECDYRRRRDALA